MSVVETPQRSASELESVNKMIEDGGASSVISHRSSLGYGVAMGYHLDLGQDHGVSFGPGPGPWPTHQKNKKTTFAG